VHQGFKILSQAQSDFQQQPRKRGCLVLHLFGNKKIPVMHKDFFVIRFRVIVIVPAKYAPAHLLLYW
jgi:hypothetical protein